MMNPDMNGYTKTPNPRKITEKRKKTNYRKPK